METKITAFTTESNSLTQSIDILNVEIDTLQVESPDLDMQITQITKEKEIIIDAKANLAIAQVQQYGVAVDVRNGDFLAMDVHQWHCNTE